MIDENFARLRTHRGNIQRYRHLLETSLTDFERELGILLPKRDPAPQRTSATGPRRPARR